MNPPLLAARRLQGFIDVSIWPAGPNSLRHELVLEIEHNVKKPLPRLCRMGHHLNPRFRVTLSVVLTET